MILRILGDHLVLHAVLPVQEKGRGGLKTAAQGDQKAVGNIAIRVAALRGLGSVHIHVKSGIVKFLLNPYVGQAGDMPQLAPYGVSHLAIGLKILSFDLDIHGSRQSEVEDLCGHVSGQEVEGSAREFTT
jgi:hypothetical protein